MRPDGAARVDAGFGPREGVVDGRDEGDDEREWGQDTIGGDEAAGRCWSEFVRVDCDEVG